MASIEESGILIQRAREVADELNCDIEEANDYTLQFDLDSAEAEQLFNEMLPKLYMTLNALGACVLSKAFRTSRSGNKHAIIKIDTPLSAERRILLQACMGSDPVREILSFIRVIKGVETPILLYVPRQEKG